MGKMKKVLAALLAAAMSASMALTAYGTDTIMSPTVGNTGEATPVSSSTLQCGTEFSVQVNEGLHFLGQTADHTVPQGADVDLQVSVYGVAPIEYQWEVSKDGGGTFEPLASTGSSHSQSDMQPLEDPQQPYIYKVTVKDGAGDEVSTEIKVLVSGDYEYRTLSIVGGDTQVSGYMHKDTKLVVEPLRSDVAGDKALIDIFASQLSEDHLPLIQNRVHLTNPDAGIASYFGDLKVDFLVGEGYNGQTLNIFYLDDDGRVVKTPATVVDGKASIEPLKKLYPFMVEVPSDSVVTITASSTTGGSITPVGKVNVEKGKDRTFTFLPWSGYGISYVKVDGIVQNIRGNSYTFTNLQENHEIHVAFYELPTEPEGGDDDDDGDKKHTVSVDCGPGGTVDPKRATVDHGDSLTITIYPDEGKVVDKVMVNGVEQSVIGNRFTIPSVKKTMKVEITFKDGTSQPGDVYLTITADSGENGFISPSGKVQVAYAGNIQFHIFPNKGYMIDKVFVDGKDVTRKLDGNCYEFINVTKHHTIKATFKKYDGSGASNVTSWNKGNRFVITASCSERGKISPEGQIYVSRGGEKTFYFIPEDGYKVNGIYIDGKKLPFRGDSYTFRNVNDDHTIYVEFNPIKVSPNTGAMTDSYCTGLLLLLSVLLLSVVCVYVRSRRRRRAGE